MKFKTFLLAGLFWLILSAAFGQQSSYYVVIGAFEVEDNAKNFMDQAHALNIPAVYAMNPQRSMFYVYVRSTINKGDAYTTLKDMQVEGYRDAWVFKGLLSGGYTFVSTDRSSQEQIADNNDQRESADPEIPVVEEIHPVVEEPKEDANEAATTPERVKPAGKAFRFNLVSSATGNSIKGLVRLQESDRSNQFRGYNGNEMVYLIPPANKSGRWYIDCQVIGYRPYRDQFNYMEAQKESGVQIGAEEEIIFPVRLERVKKGDYIEMDEVKFFSNSSILTPDSERELNELVAMMEENPNYRIRLHGHTNGNASSEIVAMGDSQEFFAMNEANQKFTASAKQLSELKAETVKAYLVSKGIDASRIATRGEGGKQPIFDPRGTHASGNARVEVEITKH
jgi:outer membrane protein OmpA-like peptidoglycan-associated protein